MSYLKPATKTITVFTSVSLFSVQVAWRDRENGLHERRKLGEVSLFHILNQIFYTIYEI